MIMKEIILCSAIWYKEIKVEKVIPNNTLPINCTTGLVFCGYRHSQCIHTKCSITGLRDAETGLNVQGFLTNKNRFVDREEALLIAIDANQVLNHDLIRGRKLYSEDLY